MDKYLVVWSYKLTPGIKDRCAINVDNSLTACAEEIMGNIFIELHKEVDDTITKLIYEIYKL